MFQCGSGSTCWSPKFLLGKPWFKISKWSQIYDPEAWIASKNHGENHKFQLEKTKSSSFMIHGLVPKPAMFVVDRNMVLEKGGVDTPVHVSRNSSRGSRVLVTHGWNPWSFFVCWGPSQMGNIWWNLTWWELKLDGFWKWCHFVFGCLLFLLLVPGFAVVLETFLAANIVKRLNR